MIELPAFDDPILRHHDQPGVRLNAAEEARLELAWRRLQLGKPCQRKRTTRTATKRRPCGGR